MKKEKIIKEQARTYLRHGNWSTLIGCLTVLFISVMLIFCIFETLLYGFNLVNLYTMEIKKSGQFLAGIFILITLFLLILITPLLNGFSKLCYNVAKNQNCSSIDLFYYFKKPSLYFKALWLNIIKYIFLSFCVFIFYLPSAAIHILSVNFSGTSNISLEIISIILKIIGFIISFCFYAKTIFSNYILADDDSKNALWYFNESFKLSKRHNIDIIKLLLSFIFWILSCFFIFPAFYVLPYMGVSLGNSAKWLIQLKKEEYD